MSTAIALTEYQWMGIRGIVFGLLLIANCRRVADFFAAFDRAEAERVERMLPKQGNVREVISIWMRRGTGESLEDRMLRYGFAVFSGLIALFMGLAALLGAWELPQ
ncbi:hypothetical protein C8N24_6406 [Solirubrobacter pauli]|uniref:Uncharacterized protein n=1 Tax=Solirubrobacter pauli TaxID=166793 RepID=A0A660L586_9ACTN|nr:hypothetical protein [Solirubrobacter pauli]RKQ88364.1 hypothetical protein C8N24_6406 [Solirubrobacter pauli]